MRRFNGLLLALILAATLPLHGGCAQRQPQQAVFDGVFAGYSSGRLPGRVEVEFAAGTDPSGQRVVFVADSRSELYVKGTKVPEGLMSFMEKAGPGSHAPLEVFTLTPDRIEYVESNGEKRIIAIRVP